MERIDVDVYVISHGGVGSNYLIRYLEDKKKLRVSPFTGTPFYQRLVHFPIKLYSDSAPHK